MTMATLDCEQGYEDDRFENPVGSNFHCSICLNVFKDPVMCQNNEHCFCRPCITTHLTNFNNCPTCMEELTPETLSPVSRLFKQCWSELNIRCNFYNRGCRELVQLGDLEMHLVNCGFTPVKCSNEGCQVEINKRDRIHHESETCEFRKTKCHDCGEIKQEISEIRKKVQDMSTLLQEIDEIKGQEMRQQQQLAALPELTREISQIKAQIATVPDQILRGLQMAEDKKKITKSNVVVAGGWNNNPGKLNTAEVFDTTKALWTELQQMNECRSTTSSFSFQNQMFVTGGWSGCDSLDTIEGLQVNPAIHSNSWMNFPGKLPTKLYGHSNIVYNGRLIAIGGCDGSNVCDGIHEILLVPPYTTRLLTRMPQKRWLHGAQLVGDDIFIFGGRKSRLVRDCFNSVIKYDIVKNECNIMSPLPYAVAKMATARWGDNVVVMGGVDKNGKVLNTVIM